MKRLIVNADDFGLHTEVNQGIIEGHRTGCITSTSLIAAGAAAEEAAQLARENPDLGVGLHLTLVAERPVLPPETIPSLTGPDGRLWPDHGVFIKRFVSGRICLDEVRAECAAQLERARALGVPLTHFDSHQHLHVLPGILDIVISLAQKAGITKLRLPAEDVFFTGGYGAPLARHIAKSGLTFCARLASGRMARAGLLSPDHFFGMLAGGHMVERNFLAVLAALPEGTSEIMVHPGRNRKVLEAVYHWGYHWEDELAAVTSEEGRRFLEQNQIKLISFKELDDE